MKHKLIGINMDSSDEFLETVLKEDAIIFLDKDISINHKCEYNLTHDEFKEVKRVTQFCCIQPNYDNFESEDPRKKFKTSDWIGYFNAKRNETQITQR